MQYNATNIYAPNANLSLTGNTRENIINCTCAGLTAQNVKGIIENCTVINLNAGINTVSRLDLTSSTCSIKNFYGFFYVPQTETYYLGLDGARGGSTVTLENITPNYENYQLLTNANYSNFFDENNILKEENTGTTLIAVENITSPVIIDKNVTLSAVRGVTGYSNVQFIEGSDGSVIEDSLINNLELNGAFLVNVHNNKLIGEDAQINLIESSNCIIENNIINTEEEYTIILDENSMDNSIQNNELIALKYTGDKSVQNSGENTIENNIPEYEEPPAVPQLKVDTTEFTIGSKSTIKASIYLDDEVATDINGGKVVFKVNGKTIKDENGKVIYAKLINGVATIEDYEIPTSWNKEGLTISAVYSGSSKCDSLRSEATQITTTMPTPEISTDNITATIGSDIELKAKLSLGTNPITTGKVVFKVNGKSIKDENGKVIYAKLDQNGETSVNYTIPENMKAKNYTITITYISSNYEKLTTTSTLTVTKT